MDDVDVRPDQPALHQRFPAARSPGLAAALVHRRDQPEFARQGEVVGADVEGRVMRSQDRHAERDQGLAVGEGAAQQPFDLPARVRHLREMRLTGLGIGLGGAVEESGADAALLECGDTSICVFGCRIVVRPVDQRRDAMVELVERAGQGGDVDVVGDEHRRQPGMHVAEIFQQGPVGRDRAQGGLPGMHVGVDQARQHEVAATVDCRRIRSFEIGTNGSDARALDQHVAPGQHAERTVLRDDDSRLEERACHAGQSPSPTFTCSGSSFMPAARASSSSSTEKSMSPGY